MRRYPKFIPALLIAAMAAGCATTGANYVPVVDLKASNKTAEQMGTDLRECQAFATQRANAAQGAMVGAVVLGLLGAALAPRDYRSNVGNRTAIVGAVAGAGEANETQQQIVSRCMAGRGYSVLN